MDPQVERILSARLRRVARVLKNLKTAAGNVPVEGELTLWSGSPEEHVVDFKVSVPYDASYEAFLQNVEAELVKVARKEDSMVEGIDLGIDVAPSTDVVAAWLQAGSPARDKATERFYQWVVDAVGGTSWYKLKDSQINGNGYSDLKWSFTYLSDPVHLLKGDFAEQHADDAFMADDSLSKEEKTEQLIEVIDRDAATADVLRSVFTEGDILYVYIA